MKQSIDEIQQDDFLKLGEEGFYQKYILANKPLLVRDGLVDWPAFSLWDDEYLAEKLGFKRLPLTQRTDEQEARFMPGSTSEKKRSFQHSLTLMRTKQEEYYISDLPLPKSLQPDIGEHGGLTAFMRLSQANRHINTYFGYGGQVTPLHYDDEENLYCVLAGQKRITLFDSADFDRLYPNHDPTSIDHSQINIDSPNPEEFPLYSDVTSFQVELNAGDILYIPCCWWHQVYSFQRHLSLAFILTDYERLLNVFRKRLNAGSFEAERDLRDAALKCLASEAHDLDAESLMDTNTPLLLAFATWARWRLTASSDTTPIKKHLAERLAHSELPLPDKYFFSNILRLENPEIRKLLER